MRVLVTGGAGFIGSHLCASLLNKGYEVYCLDNLITGDEKNLAPLKNKPEFHFINLDICNNPQALLDKLSPDYIYHLASPASPPQYIKFAIETLLVNSLGTYKMLEIAKLKNSRFLLASTSEVYGDPKEHPQKESYFGNVNPVGIRACYDESKRFAESITMEYFRKYNSDVRIIRIFNTYGPNMQADDGRVVSNFITQALSDQDITIFGDGTQTLSFCYVSDLVQGLIKAMENPGTVSKIINLGNPNELTIRELADIILKKVGSKSRIIHQNSRLQDDPERRKPDISKAKQLLDFEPQVDLSAGLEKTIAYFRSLELKNKNL